MTAVSTLRTLCMFCYDDTRNKSSQIVIADDEKSEAEGYNDLCEMKVIVLLEKRHDNEKSSAFILSLM